MKRATKQIKFKFAKTFVLSFVFVLIFCAAAFSQNDTTAPCPAISVTGPAYVPAENEPQIFTAKIGKEIENFNVKYEWSASSGEIIEGQGTLVVKVLLNDNLKSLTVTLKVKGLPENCSNTFSEAMIYDQEPQALLIEELSSPIEQIKEAGSFEKLAALNEDSNAQLYIIIKYKKNTPQKNIARTERKLFSNLIKAGIEKERITLVKDFAETESMQFWLVPAGANIPLINQ